MKIFSWNVNGIRANLNKGGLQTLISEESPDIICIQEVKAKPGQAVIDLPDYEEYWNSAVRPGYSGTAIFTKIRPLRVEDNYVTDSSNETHGFHRTFLPRNFCQSKTFQGTPLGSTTRPDELCENTHLMHELRDKASDLDFRDSFGDPLTEGRVQTAEFSEFFLVNVYTPNSKRGLERLTLREKLWDPTFLNYLKELEKTKPVIVCGDFNAAHTEIDLARPESNRHNAGFTDEERKGISNLISAGFIDSFRFLNPESRRYTWWSHMRHARENNVGWRIDYFFLSNSLKEKLKSAEIYENILGSDHCPISIEVDLK